MIATTTEATVVSDAVTTEVRTGRGAQVAFLRNGRLAFLTLNSTTVEVSGADDGLLAGSGGFGRVPAWGSGCRPARVVTFRSPVLRDWSNVGNPGSVQGGFGVG